MQECYNYEDYLAHHGVKGMKWGVRKERKLDIKTAKSLKRHVAAGKKNLGLKARIYDEDVTKYNDADRAYRKEMSRFTLNSRQKRAAVRDASEKLTLAGAEMTKSRAEYKRAERIYDSDAKKYKKHVNRMIEKYGDDEVRKVSSKERNVGENMVKELINTGITIVNMPIIGDYYTSAYIGGRERAERERYIDKESKRDKYRS